MTTFPKATTPVTTTQWIDYFRENATKHRIDWGQQPTLDPERDAELLRSLQSWQKGETSEGSHLLAAVRKFVARFGDPGYIEATKLFIKEEQKHGENLGRYLDRVGTGRRDFDAGDWLFRRVRYFNASIEIWTVTVVIVELLAQMYYAALAKAAGCPLLGDICRDILIDEGPHIRFQVQRLQTIVSRRHPALKYFALAFYGIHSSAIVRIVWLTHGHVFKQAGYTYDSYRRKINGRFAQVVAELTDQDQATAS